MSEVAVAELETPILESTETTQADAPVESTTPVSGDADPQSPVDAAPASDEASLDSEYEAYLQTQTSKESGEPAPEPEARESEPHPPEVAIDPQQYMLAKRNYDNVYVRGQQAIGAIEKALTEALGETIAKELTQPLKNHQNELHANGLNFWGLEASTQMQAKVNSAWETQIRKGIEAFVPKADLPSFDKWLDEAAAKSNGVVSHKDWMDKAFELRLKREGFVPKAKYEADTKQRWIDGRRQREKAGEVGGAASGGAISGAGSGGRSEDDLLADPRTPIETVNKILARRNGG